MRFGNCPPKGRELAEAFSDEGVREPPNQAESPVRVGNDYVWPGIPQAVLVERVVAVEFFLVWVKPQCYAQLVRRQGLACAPDEHEGPLGERLAFLWPLLELVERRREVLGHRLMCYGFDVGRLLRLGKHGYQEKAVSSCQFGAWVAGQHMTVC